MLAYIKTDSRHENRRDFSCASCGAFIARSSDIIRINGAQNHSHVNPAGVRCNFMTIRQWENALEGQDLYLEHSWFEGYGWRFMVCAHCALHLGWIYEAVSGNVSPDQFAGLLISSVTVGSSPEK